MATCVETCGASKTLPDELAWCTRIVLAGTVPIFQYSSPQPRCASRVHVDVCMKTCVSARGAHHVCIEACARAVWRVALIALPPRTLPIHTQDGGKAARAQMAQSEQSVDEARAILSNARATNFKCGARMTHAFCKHAHASHAVVHESTLLRSRASSACATHPHA